MSTAEKKAKLSWEEYFAYEDSIEGMAEYFNGEIFDMSGGSLNHSRITRNLTTLVDNLIKDSECEAFTPDARLQIEAANSFVRPDLWVICGQPEKMPGRNDTAKNPTLVAEVLSPSTSNFDRTGKFTQYRLLPTLREYVLVEQDHPQLDVFFRTEFGAWEFSSVTDLDGEVTFRSLGISVKLADIYRNVDFEAQPTP